ncbi:helix-turn-helix domain-containing protein [Streptomyces alboflavus]|uniref:helix-turn-helix domain-containing protein n=1 Tax=Streptomyces alboflavus TaxID=67267 RepID=UPI0004C27726|nr:helix-turn-helix domain-containing protein [Streptomyces alboflavus]
MAVLVKARPSRGKAERALIERLTRARKAPRDLVVRARMVELSWSGQRVPTIAEELGCGQKTVRRWLHRFNRSGVAGLEDLGGQGRKRRITEAERSRIIALVRTLPPGRLRWEPVGELWAPDELGPAEWTLSSLATAARAEGIRVGRSQVRRILLAEGVRWRRPRSWTRSADLDFVPKGHGSSGCTPIRRRAPRSSAPTNSVR